MVQCIIAFTAFSDSTGGPAAHAGHDVESINLQPVAQLNLCRRQLLSMTTGPKIGQTNESAGIAALCNHCDLGKAPEVVSVAVWQAQPLPLPSKTTT